MIWGPKEWGTLIGVALSIIAANWHLGNKHTSALLDSLSLIKGELHTLSGRVTKIEDGMTGLNVDQATTRDRLSRNESRTDMLYIIFGVPHADPFPRPEEDKRKGVTNRAHGRRRTDLPFARPGEEDE
jgi:hypothetical protein